MIRFNDMLLDEEEVMPWRRRSRTVIRAKERMPTKEKPPKEGGFWGEVEKAREKGVSKWWEERKEAKRAKKQVQRGTSKLKQMRREGKAPPPEAAAEYRRAREGTQAKVEKSIGEKARAIKGELGGALAKIRGKDSTEKLATRAHKAWGELGTGSKRTVIGGAAVAGVGAVMAARKMMKRRKEKRAREAQMSRR